MMSVTVAKPPRKDKKREIKAPMSQDMITIFEEKADIHKMSVMKYLENLTDKAVNTDSIIRGLMPYFRRGYIPRYAPNTALLGRVVAPNLEALLPEGTLNHKRQSVKFLPDNHLAVCEIAYALDTSHSRALSILLNECIVQGVDL